MIESPLPICGTCGVVFAIRNDECVHCHAARQELVVEPRSDGANWVCVECTFKCRRCGFRVPLNALDVDGVVTCARCGGEQALEVEQWDAILNGAHATGDLWGDLGPEFLALLPPELSEIGTLRSSRVVEGSGDSRLVATTSPGRPLCEACYQPLEVIFDSAAKSHRTVASCSCGQTAAYETPQKAREMAPILATICAEQRIDQKAVKVEATPTAIAIRCPGCDAPLPIDETTKVVRCAYCNLQARVPDRAWFRLSKKEHVPEPMWLLFGGSSRERRAFLEAQRIDVERGDALRKKNEREQDEARRASNEQMARTKAAAEKERQRDAADAAARAERDRRKREQAASDVRVKVVVYGLLAALVIAIGIWKTSQEAAHDRERAALAHAQCSPQTPAACMDTAKKSLGFGNYGPAVEDYETACNAHYDPACLAVELLCESDQLGITTRLRHFERYCDLGKLADCNAAGTLYANATGRGLAKDEKAAAALYAKSCAGGSSEGCTLLAASCKRGVKEACSVIVDGGSKR